MSHRSNMSAAEIAQYKSRFRIDNSMDDTAQPMKDTPKRYREICDYFQYLATEALAADFPFIREVDRLIVFPISEEVRLGIDGQCQDRNNTCTIALSESLMLFSHGVEYSLMVYLHELAHVKEHNHSDSFGELLDRMIAAFNKKHKYNIHNDYYDNKKANVRKT